jgi:hypothetical protein
MNALIPATAIGCRTIYDATSPKQTGAEFSVPADYVALKRWYKTVSSRPSAAA